MRIPTPSVMLLLAAKANIDDHPNLKPYQKLPSDAEKMVVLPPSRMMWGTLADIRHPKIMITRNAPVIVILILASLLFSLMAASGKTIYPAWMAAVNPVTLTIAWLLLKRIIPQMIRDVAKGAGFNFAYLIFFICSTTILWQA